ncbi:hypothetical protein PMAYCL1PPCAC_20632, partial [Pristionchus mayeri]
MAQQNMIKSASDEIWQELETGLGQIFRNEPITPTRYMQLQTYVCDYCFKVSMLEGVNSPQEQQSKRSDHLKRIADFVSSELYIKLSAYLKNHVGSILEECRTRNGEEQLRYFNTQWDNFRRRSNVVDGIFG